MNDEAKHVRLLPWTGSHGQPCLLLTDGEGTASRVADRIERTQLGLAGRLLGRARAVLPDQSADGSQWAPLAGQLTDALHDVLLIAESRGARLGGGLAEHRRFGRIALPGSDLTSACFARRHVRDTADTWGLPHSVIDDLETIAGELVANALEHSDSHTITVDCGLTSRTAVISVTDEGGGPTSAALPTSAELLGLEQERGRGLLITQALAVRWGTLRDGGELTVWAEVPMESPESAG
ncbi:ATP-binding protein [Streptomyces sp. 11x1]|uniref:ATP-binding protein n=1 Tax=Streptomyces sp. 11x1 TaxID=3038642 RepID=UPI00292CD513|nr:ATP-binding protein [Streptomyces sp. 11x1]WNZ08293.1 ATP-binding protein [Streptomyces sp. 11x1]